MTSLLNGLEIDEPQIGKCKIIEVTSVEGEAVANNRKGKLIFFYEWVIKCNWQGLLNNDSDEINGKFEIPNLSEENSAEDITIDVSLDTTGPKADILKDIMRNKGLALIQEQMQKYILALRDDFAKDMIKPTKFSNNGSINSFQTDSQLKTKKEMTFSPSSVSKSQPALKSSDVGVKIETANISISDSFKCRADEFYRVLTDANLLRAFTQSDVTVDPIVGGKFSLLGGNIEGKFTQLDINTCIKQEWRLKSWPAGHYSEVTITITEKEDSTYVTIKQSGIPKLELERTEEGWKRHYFESIKKVFGFGSSFF